MSVSLKLQIQEASAEHKDPNADDISFSGD